ncbi:hypothetical protein [Sphingobacterium tabacisoli]|uniref:Uncharacterized protein n=1 Tax=Sphingobacterium tabacisoli TaxID=2044855 RepID=A0ABW5L591_9SPHI|nr:hypothetical protein [Sphingobacterium tabacisoli]
MMTQDNIIQQAKHFFGKDRKPIKDLILSFEFKSKRRKQWRKDIEGITSHPYEVRFNLFDKTILSILDNEVDKIDWNWIGDLSWTIDILLTPDIENGYDWDKKLATKCNGTARLLTVFVSKAIPCFTYDSHYMTYSKKDNYYEFGPIDQLTKTENKIVTKISKLLTDRGLQYVGKPFCNLKFKELYSDTNDEGNASLFDVLFSDTKFYTTEIMRFCDKDIIEKSGQKFRWTEYYNKKGILDKRIESRWTKSGDYFKLVLDGKSQILNVGVTRNQIKGKKNQSFELDIKEKFKKRNNRKKD